MITAKKSLGQNFLIDKNIIKKISNLISLFKKDVIEIGPGKGALTDEIIKKKPKSLIIIEKDERLVKFLEEKYSAHKKIKIINEDILKFDLEKIVKKNTVILGNLPYNISSQILVKIIKFKKWPLIFSDLILMFQKELGEKIFGVCPSPSYGRLSILANWKLIIRKICDVKPDSFSPRPKVDSSLLLFKPRKDFYKINNPKNLEKITRIFFSNRRKMVKKPFNQIFNGDLRIAEKYKINLNLRPQNLNFETYYKLTEEYEKLTS